MIPASQKAPGVIFKNLLVKGAMKIFHEKAAIISLKKLQIDSHLAFTTLWYYMLFLLRTCFFQFMHLNEISTY